MQKLILDKKQQEESRAISQLNSNPKVFYAFANKTGSLVIKLALSNYQMAPMNTVTIKSRKYSPSSTSLSLPPHSRTYQH
jgi:hypothetical protein